MTFPKTTRTTFPRMASAVFAILLASGAPLAAHSTMIINDPVSPGILGDDKLSLHEALRLANGSLQIFEVSPAEAAQVILDPGRFQIDTLIFDETVFPGTIRLEAPLPVLDDPIGDYIDGTNFNLFPIGSMVLDGSLLPAGTPAFDVRAGNTGIYGWRLRGFPGHGIHVRPNPTFDVMRGLLIQRNVIEGCEGVGILLENGARDRIDWAFLLLENWVVDCTLGGLHVDAGTGTNVQMNLTVEANFVADHGSTGERVDGIAIRGGNGGSATVDGRLVDNRIFANAGSGILIDGGLEGSQISLILTGNETLANGIGITVFGTTGAGLAPNDVSVSVRTHRSIQDRLAGLLLTAGTDALSSDAFCSVSLNDFVAIGGGELAGILASSGEGSGNQLSLSIARSEILQPRSNGLEVAASRWTSGAQRVDLRCVSLHVIDPGGDGLVFRSGGGTPSELRASLDAVHVAGARHGLLVDGLPSVPAADRCELRVTACRFSRSRVASSLVRARAGASFDVRFRESCFDGTLGDDVVLEDPLRVGGVTLDLGRGGDWGYNSFLGATGCALVVPSGSAPIDGIGNYFGDASGPRPVGGGKCVQGAASTSPFLASDLSLLLDLSLRQVTPGTAFGASLRGRVGSNAALFVGTRMLDLTAFGQPLTLDPTSGPVLFLGVFSLPHSAQLAVPPDPALTGERLLFQAFGAEPRDVRLSRVHALSIVP